MAGLKKSTQNRILKMWEGSKNRKGVHSARAIAEMLGVPRRQVMTFLENEGVTSYSEGSYS
jgi:phage pi2 protein 07